MPLDGWFPCFSEMNEHDFMCSTAEEMLSLPCSPRADFQQQDKRREGLTQCCYDEAISGVVESVSAMCCCSPIRHSHTRESNGKASIQRFHGTCLLALIYASRANTVCKAH